MDILEAEMTTSARGNLVIPAHMLEELGVGPQTPVTVLSPVPGPGETREFLVVPPGWEGEGGMPLEIPLELLEKAGISEDADLTVLCRDGRICLLPSEQVENGIPKEVLELCEALGIPAENARLILETARETEEDQ